MHPAGHPAAARRRAWRTPPRLKGDDVVALALVGDGGTSEGDFHEALNFAAVWQAPVVFLVQNNGFAISVPLAKQTAAPSLAHKGVGYGMPGRAGRRQRRGGRARRCSARPSAHARAGRRADLVEAHHLPHGRRTPTPTTPPATATTPRSRPGAAHDPIARLERVPARRAALLDDDGIAAVADGGRGAWPPTLRDRMNADPALDPLELFAHVYAEPTPQLREQRRPAARPSWPSAEDSR